MTAFYLHIVYAAAVLDLTQVCIDAQGVKITSPVSVTEIKNA